MSLVSEEALKAEQQAALLVRETEEASRTASAAFSIEEARRLHEVMQGKLYLSDEEMHKVLRDQAVAERRDGTKRNVTASGAEVADRDSVTTAKPDEASAREVTETARPVSIGNEPEGQRRESVTPIQSAIGILHDDGDAAASRSDRRHRLLATNAFDIDPHSLPIEAQTANPGRGADHALMMQILDHARAARAGDRGDQSAADRVIAAIEGGASLAVVMQDFSYLRAAESVSDIERTYRTKDGRTVTVTKVDDGDGSPTVEYDVSGGDSYSSDSPSYSSGGRRRTGGMLATAVAMGAVAAAASEPGQRGIRDLITASADIPGLNPFALASPDTPARDLQQNLGLFLA
jgi:hypothetical protein